MKIYLEEESRTGKKSNYLIFMVGKVDLRDLGFHSTVSDFPSLYGPFITLQIQEESYRIG